MKDVIRLQTFLTSADDIGGFMKARQAVFATYFPEGAYPPNTLLVVSRLVRPERSVEIEAMAGCPRAAARRAPARRRKARRQPEPSREADMKASEALPAPCNDADAISVSDLADGG